jgi:hypothetical protein
VQHRAALAAVRAHQRLLLGRDEPLRLLARRERLAAGDETERVQPGHVGDCRARRSAAELQQQVAILAGDEAGAVGDVVARRAGDVRDAVLVPGDREARAAGGLGRRRTGRAERLRLEEPVDVRVGHVAGGVRPE